MADVPRYRVRADVRVVVARRDQSQNRFALRSGITSGHFSQLLSGKRLAGPETRRRLLEALKPMAFDEIFEEILASPARTITTSPREPVKSRLVEPASLPARAGKGR